jgi:hypothetical protein
MTWVVLINLWGPALEINRGYGDLTNRIKNVIDKHSVKRRELCVTIDLNDLKSRAMILANSNLKINQPSEQQSFECDFFLVRQTVRFNLNANSNIEFNENKWNLAWSGNREADPRKKETFYLYKKN